MKFSNRLLLFLAGVVFVLLGLFLFTNPVANLVAYSWWISFGLLVSSIAAILGYFSAPKRLRSPVYLFQGFVSLLLALYLVACRGHLNQQEEALIYKAFFVFLKDFL